MGLDVKLMLKIACVRAVLYSLAIPASSMTRREPVMLNVYDMLKTNEYTSSLGIGVFHTGVQVYGSEYAYAGHRFSNSGIFEIEPRNHTQLSGGSDHFRFRQSIRMGRTHYTYTDIRRILRQLGKSYTGESYHLIKNNCNHFSNCLVQMLCGCNIPPWINRLATVTARVPFIYRILPHEWLTPCNKGRAMIEHQAEDEVDTNRELSNCF